MTIVPSTSAADQKALRPRIAAKGVGLLPDHRADLLRAIDPSVIEERGYYSLHRGNDAEAAENLKRLKNLGIVTWARNDPSRLPAIVIPSFHPVGEHSGCIVRFDDAPVNPQTDKPAKYIPSRIGGVIGGTLDCHPRNLVHMADPAVDLWVTEGIKKADAITSRGGCAVAISGVYNWRDKQHGTVGQWENIQLRGRRIIICFDDDAATNPNVGRAMSRFGKWLISRGAKPLYVVTPSLPDREGKTGADDFLAAGNTLSDLREACRLQPPETAQDQGQFSDAILAERLADEALAGKFAWASGVGWMAWDGARWADSTEIAVRESVRIWVIEKFQEALDLQKRDIGTADHKNTLDGWRQRLSDSGRKSLISSAQGVVEFVLVHGKLQLDQDPDVLNTPGGVVDLTTGEMRAREDGEPFRKVTGAQYVPGARHPVWDKALESVPEDIRDWFQVFMGQAITGHPSTEGIVLLAHGGGENGKTLIMTHGIRQAIGDYFTLVSNRALTGSGDNHPTELMDFMGARLAVLEETQEARKLDTQRIKQISDTPEITARRMRQDPVTYNATHTLIINTNHRPVVPETDHGTWRRLLSMPFPYRFVKPGEYSADNPQIDISNSNVRLGDPFLKHRMESDKRVQVAVLAWLVEGAVKWYEAGRQLLPTPARIAEDTLDWRAKTDLILAYMTAGHLSVDPGSHILKKDLFDDFNDFIVGQGHHLINDRLFSDRLTSNSALSGTDLECKKIRKGSPAAGVRSMRPGTGATPTPATYLAWLGLRFGTGDEPPPPQLSPFVPETPPPPPAAPIEPDPVPDVEEAPEEPQAAAELPDESVSQADALVDEVSSPHPIEGTVLEPGTPEYDAVDLSTWSMQADQALREGMVTTDIESPDKVIWPLRDDFIRITGIQQGSEITISTDAAAVAETIAGATINIGHNSMGFDLVAYALYQGLDILKLAAEERVHDTMLTEILIDPPAARTEIGMILKHYALDAIGNRRFEAGKTDHLPTLAKEFGGYGAIPVDDARYVSYCAGDVNLTTQIAATQPRTPYVIREHKAAAIAAQMRINGFRVDVELLQERLEAGREKRKVLIAQLAGEYGLPLLRTANAGPGKRVGDPYDAPQGTKAGKAAIAAAFADLDVTLGSSKSGKGPGLDKESMQAIIDSSESSADAVALAETVQSLNGIRSVYETVDRYRIGDRVHPNITMYQSSGRWSITEPGITVMGKRNGKHVERDIFLAEEGEVMMCFDLSQADARAVAVHSQDRNYMKIFQDGLDLHTEVAVAVFGEKARHDKSIREFCKPITHGWNYNMGLTKLSLVAGSMDVARQYDQTMREQYPELIAWKNRVVALGDADQLIDNGFGRLLKCTPGHAYTQAPALVGQATTADWVKEGLLRLWAIDPIYMTWLRLYVHDEIGFSVPISRVDEAREVIASAMTFDWAPREDFTPIEVLAEAPSKWSPSWGQCYA